MIDETDSIRDTVLIDMNFNTDRCHILQEICQKFDRVSSVKWTSLYFKSRARPAIKHTSRIHSTKTQVGPPNYNIRPTETPNNSSLKSNKNIKILKIIKII